MDQAQQLRNVIKKQNQKVIRHTARASACMPKFCPYLKKRWQPNNYGTEFYGNSKNWRLLQTFFQFCSSLLSYIIAAVYHINVTVNWCFPPLTLRRKPGRSTSALQFSGTCSESMTLLPDFSQLLSIIPFTLR